MSDSSSRAPSPDPWVGQLPNTTDIFWWEVKARSYNATVSSATQWRWLRQHFAAERGRFTVSLEGSHVPVNHTVYALFHQSAIVDKGSWVRMNVTLRHLYASSRAERTELPLAVKLGTLTYEW